MWNGEAPVIRQWLEAFRDAIWADEPTARDAALIAAFAVLVPFGWLILLVRPIRRALRNR